MINEQKAREDSDNLLDRIYGLSKFIQENIDKNLETRSKNMEICNEILNEIGSPTNYVKEFLIFVANTIPISPELLNKVKTTATKKEQKILKKYGVKL